VKPGFCKAAYQVGIFDVVNIEPINPAHKQAANARSNFTIFNHLLLTIIENILSRV
jgi:hypothetical protein